MAHCRDEHRHGLRGRHDVHFGDLPGSAGWRTVMMIGSAAYALRFFLFAFSLFQAVALPTLALHGVAFASSSLRFFTFVGEFFPKNAQTSAQGLFTLLFAGIGPFAGNNLGAFLKTQFTSRRHDELHACLHDSGDHRGAGDDRDVLLLPSAAESRGTGSSTCHRLTCRRMPCVARSGMRPAVPQSAGPSNDVFAPACFNRQFEFDGYEASLVCSVIRRVEFRNYDVPFVHGLGAFFTDKPRDFKNDTDTATIPYSCHRSGGT